MAFLQCIYPLHGIFFGLLSGYLIGFYEYGCGILGGKVFSKKLFPQQAGGRVEGDDAGEVGIGRALVDYYRFSGDKSEFEARIYFLDKSGFKKRLPDKTGGQPF